MPQRKNRDVEKARQFVRDIREHRTQPSVVSHGDVISYTRIFYNKNRQTLRDWWHSLLRERDHYPCYAMFLALPSDAETLRYLVLFGQELDLISGKNCLVLAIGKPRERLIGFNQADWNSAVMSHILEGGALEIAELFEIELAELPCLVIFRDIRSPEHVVVSLKKMTAEEISETIRRVFSIIGKAVSNKKNPLIVLGKRQGDEMLASHGRAIVSAVRKIAEKTFESAMTSWINTNIK